MSGATEWTERFVAAGEVEGEALAARRVVVDDAITPSGFGQCSLDEE